MAFTCNFYRKGFKFRFRDGLHKSESVLDRLTALITINRGQMRKTRGPMGRRSLTLRSQE